MYIMNKYLLLSTPNYNFCYWVWENFKCFNQTWGVAGPKSLRSAGLEELTKNTDVVCQSRFQPGVQKEVYEVYCTQRHFSE
jgi:hypothetical protein